MNNCAITHKNLKINDENFGFSNEEKVINKLNKKYRDKFSLIEYRFSQFDFENENFICELKSRRCCHNEYPTTMVGMSKFKKLDKDKNYRFYFLFTDGLYYWNYNEEKITVRNAGRRDRKAKEYKPHAFIDIEHLNLEDDTLSSLT